MAFTPYSINETEEYISSRIVQQNREAAGKQQQILALLIVVTVLIFGAVMLFINYFLGPLEQLTEIVRRPSQNQSHR